MRFLRFKEENYATYIEAGKNIFVISIAYMYKPSRVNVVAHINTNTGSRNYHSSCVEECILTMIFPFYH